ncbi:peptidase domain-containing ABC transporter [Robiginitomaculum antarcticum]|uniref:peptidase domain-containing ABC transporter n=1 Tax=Robiginitomaculum antarcticum TaxID=437507 RepID=UPI00036780F6|nr:peptidase domain-containing ABC transporter [Robiginitomaculum antarcticum]
MNRLPVIHQTEATECGLACLAMIANYHGHDLDLNALRQRVSVSLKGATLKSLMQMAGDLGLGTRALRLDMDHITQLQCPAILHWDMNHFVVLKKIARGKAHIHDPGRGLVVMSLAALSDHFTGVALEVTPSADFTPVTSRMRARMSQLWSRLIGLKRAVVQTLLLSAVLQLMVLATPFFLQFVIDGALPGNNFQLLAALAIGFAGLAIIRAVSEGVRSWAILIYGNQMSYQMVANVFRHLLRLPAAYFEKRHVGDIISRMNSTQPIQQALTQDAVAVLIDGVMAVITLAVMFMFSPLLAAIVAGSTAVLALITLLIYPHMRRTQEDAIVTRAVENTHLIESIRASTTIKLFGRETAREGAWRNLYADFINANIKYGQWMIWQKFADTLIGGLQLVAVVYFGARLIMTGEAGFTIGMLFAFMMYRQLFAQSATMLLTKGIQFRLLGLHLERLSDVVYATPEAITDHSGGLEKAIAGEITLDNVSFRYSEDDPWILRHVNLVIPAGEMLAITGKSGGGKTTLMKLMLGLYEPSEGRILIDGMPLADFGIQNWRRRLGVVMQDDKLMSGTIADNISFFDPEMEMETVIRAAKAAQIHEDIASMPMNYLSMVGDMGSILSGGQKQRVILARALYHNPDVLFLDEGTANLDVLTEAQIADVVENLPQTRIIVAHRPEFLNRSDRILEIATI